MVGMMTLLVLKIPTILAQVALDAGNKDVSALYVNAGHTFEGKEEELGDVIMRWLDRRILGG